MREFPITRAERLKLKPDPQTLVFGKTFTDYMFLLNYDEGRTGPSSSPKDASSRRARPRLSA